MGGYTPIYYAHKDRNAIFEWGPARWGSFIGRGISLPEDDPDDTTLFAEFLNPDGAYYTEQVWLDCKPGTTFSYSNTGYDLLGHLVEQTSGRPLDDYLKEEIFEPLGMSHTARLSEEPPYSQATPTERVYGVLSKTNLETPIYGDVRVGAGSLHSNVKDLAQFLIAHMNQGEVDGVRLLEPETVELMHDRHTLSNADIGQEAYGYGWAHYQEKPWQFWGSFFQFYGAQGHGGQDIGYRARIYTVNKGEGGFGVIVLTNMGTLFKSDIPWFFSTPLQLETLLMEEAQRLWAEVHPE
jgi:CubicO group peptidase (beta-lactamase class C family)